MMKDAFYFILIAFFVLKIFLSWLVGYVEKTTWLERYNVNFETDDITAWLTNNYNAHIAQYLHSHKKRKDSLETRAEPAVFSL